MIEFIPIQYYPASNALTGRAMPTNEMKTMMVNRAHISIVTEPFEGPPVHRGMFVMGNTMFFIADTPLNMTWIESGHGPGCQG